MWLRSLATGIVLDLGPSLPGIVLLKTSVSPMKYAVYTHPEMPFGLKAREPTERPCQSLARKTWSQAIRHVLVPQASIAVVGGEL